MRKSNQVIAGIGLLICGVLLLAADRLFVSASSASYTAQVTILTTVALFVILVGAIWLFKTTIK